MARSRKRALPMDEDYGGCILQAVWDGTCRSSAAFLQSHGRQTQVGTKLEGRYINEYQAAGWMVGAKRGDLSIAPDGTRVGNPAEETLVIPTWSAKAELGMRIPPMVHLGGSAKAINRIMRPITFRFFI